MPPGADERQRLLSLLSPLLSAWMPSSASGLAIGRRSAAKWPMLRRLSACAWRAGPSQLGCRVGHAGSDREFPRFTARSGTQRARAYLGEHLIRSNGRPVQGCPSTATNSALVPRMSPTVGRSPVSSSSDGNSRRARLADPYLQIEVPAAQVSEAWPGPAGEGRARRNGWALPCRGRSCRGQLELQVCAAV